tara:strand:+ start:522 stop:884 length:363 start_codon:yes stop_codon:yes gene_type:complete
MKSFLALVLFFYLIILNAQDHHNQVLIVKCKEITGTGKSDIFRIKNPNFEWYYKGRWYELTNSEIGVGKDWIVKFSKNIITLYNKKTKWKRLIDMKKMTALMKFPTGEEYLYICNTVSDI